MEFIKISQLVKNGTGLCVFIPKSILTGLKWQRGDQIVVQVANTDCVHLHKLSDEEILNLKHDDLSNLH